MRPNELENKIDLYGPLAQAGRCLDVWLKEEKRRLGGEEKKRVAALMARYFLHEDQVTDPLIMSFLHRFSGRAEEAAPALDIEDPASVRAEISALLEKAAQKSAPPWRWPAFFAVLTVIAALAFGLWDHGRQPITPEQQAVLKTLVRQITAADPSVTAAFAWKQVKTPLHVTRYQDIRVRDYAASLDKLEELLRAAQKKQAPLPPSP